MDEIIACLEQKVLLLTKIWNLTKQIEVRCMEPEVELDQLLDLRGIYIERVNKCNSLIQKLTKNFSAEQQEHLTRIFRQDLSDEQCNSDEERKILKLTRDCAEILQKAGALDKAARETLNKQCMELKEKINQLRKEEKDYTLYRNIK
ncbi:MAG: hypothetical protein GX485_07355 [Clostridiales bacterium]|jgi:hypothetical protein|nr:hypothetical protein [Clostridiales bacterium]